MGYLPRCRHWCSFPELGAAGSIFLVPRVRRELNRALDSSPWTHGPPSPQTRECKLPSRKKCRGLHRESRKETLCSATGMIRFSDILLLLPSFKFLTSISLDKLKLQYKTSSRLFKRISYAGRPSLLCSPTI